MPFEKGMSGNPDGQGKESEYVVAGNKTPTISQTIDV